jgi:hypothetical protein
MTDKAERAKEARIIRRAVLKRDSVSLLKVANYLRFVKGLNYQEILERINTVQPLGLPEFDAMMQEGEHLESLPPE